MMHRWGCRESGCGIPQPIQRRKCHSEHFPERDGDRPGLHEVGCSFHQHAGPLGTVGLGTVSSVRFVPWLTLFTESVIGSRPVNYKCHKVMLQNADSRESNHS